MIGKNIRLVIEPVEPNEVVVSQLLTAPDGYFESIEVFDILEVDSTQDILEKISLKVNKKGKLSLQGFDGLSFCKKMIENADHMYGKQVVFQNFYSIGFLKEYFQKTGWKVNFANISSGRYNLEVERY